MDFYKVNWENKTPIEAPWSDLDDAVPLSLLPDGTLHLGLRRRVFRLCPDETQFHEWAGVHKSKKEQKEAPEEGMKEKCKFGKQGALDAMSADERYIFVMDDATNMIREIDTQAGAVRIVAGASVEESLSETVPGETGLRDVSFSPSSSLFAVKNQITSEERLHFLDGSDLIRTVNLKTERISTVRWQSVFDLHMGHSHVHHPRYVWPEYTPEKASENSMQDLDKWRYKLTWATTVTDRGYSVTHLLNLETGESSLLTGKTLIPLVTLRPFLTLAIAADDKTPDRSLVVVDWAPPHKISVHMEYNVIVPFLIAPERIHVLTPSPNSYILIASFCTMTNQLYAVHTSDPLAVVRYSNFIPNLDELKMLPQVKRPPPAAPTPIIESLKDVQANMSDCEELPRKHEHVSVSRDGAVYFAQNDEVCLYTHDYSAFECVAKLKASSAEASCITSLDALSSEEYVWIEDQDEPKKLWRLRRADKELELYDAERMEAPNESVGLSVDAIPSCFTDTAKQRSWELQLKNAHEALITAVEYFPSRLLWPAQFSSVSNANELDSAPKRDMFNTPGDSIDELDMRDRRTTWATGTPARFLPCGTMIVNPHNGHWSVLYRNMLVPIATLKPHLTLAMEFELAQENDEDDFSVFLVLVDWSAPHYAFRFEPNQLLSPSSIGSERIKRLSSIKPHESIPSCHYNSKTNDLLVVDNIGTRRYKNVLPDSLTKKYLSIESESTSPDHSTPESRQQPANSSNQNFEKTSASCPSTSISSAHDVVITHELSGRKWAVHSDVLKCYEGLDTHEKIEVKLLPAIASSTIAHTSIEAFLRYLYSQSTNSDDLNQAFIETRDTIRLCSQLGIDSSYLIHLLSQVILPRLTNVEVCRQMVALWFDPNMNFSDVSCVVTILLERIRAHVSESEMSDAFDSVELPPETSPAQAVKRTRSLCFIAHPASSTPLFQPLMSAQAPSLPLSLIGQLDGATFSRLEQ